MPTKLVMLKLADNANEDGSNVKPAQTTVAKQCGCSVRTVQRVVQEQTKVGILVEVPTPGNRPNEYRFDMAAVRQRVTLTESHPDRVTGLSMTHSRASTTESHPINKNRQLTVIQPSVLADAWASFLTTYPKRSGDRGTSKGQEKFRALLKSGIDVQEILDGVTRYARYCQERGIVGTEYVKQIPTFLNGKAWLEDFSLPSVPKPGSAPRRKNASEVDFV